MTAIPLEVSVPQVFSPGSSRPSSVPTPSTCFPFAFAWRGGGSVVGTLHGHKFSSGPKVGVPEINSRVHGTALAAAPSKADQPHFNWVRVTAQSGSQIRSQHSLHDRNLGKMTA